MSKIINYISAGKGIGALLLLAFSVIVSVIFAVYIRFAGVSLIPMAQDIADQLLPVRIENGRVVEPANAYKTVHLNLDDGSYVSLPLVIDTRTDNFNTSELPQGIYLSRTALYSVSSNQTKIIRLKDNIDLPRADYTDTFRSLLNWTAVLTGFFGIAFMFIFYFILTFFYAACSILLAALEAKKLDFDQRMRLAAVALLCAYTVILPLRLLGLGLGTIVLFLTVIIFQGLFIRKLPAPPQPDSATPPSAA